MINKITLNNFKGVKQGEVNLTPLTILVGSNNAGKTTILEALFLAPNPVRQVPYGDSAVSIVRRLHQTLDSSGYSFLMLDYRAKQASIECQLDAESYSLKFWAEYNNILITTNKQKTGGYKFPASGTRPVAFANLLLRSNDIDIEDPNPFIGDSLLINTSLLEEGYLYLRRNWASVMNSDISRKVIKEVSELSFEKYTDLTLEPFFENTFALYAFREDGKRIRLGDLGEGIQTYILARMLYEMQQPDMLLWDDVESHFNPRMLIQLSSWFSDLIKNGKQVVLATHSLEAIQLLSEEHNPDTSVILTSLKDNILNARILSIDEVEELRQAGIDVRMAESLLL